jgi:hypothetical protein
MDCKPAKLGKGLIGLYFICGSVTFSFLIYTSSLLLGRILKVCPDKDKRVITHLNLWQI